MAYLVIVPSHSKDLYDSFKITFKSVILMNNTIDDTNFIIKFINSNNFGKLIFVDYIDEYAEVINGLYKKYDIKFIYTYSLASLSDPYKLDAFNSIYSYYKNKIVDSIGFVDWSFYNVFLTKGDNVFKINLDVPKVLNNNIKTGQIGLINNENEGTHSFYNELSAISLSNKFVANLFAPNKVTMDFVDLFNVSVNISDSFDDLISSNDVNLYINFTNNDVCTFIKSMDCGVPCIIGNNTFLIDYPILCDYLMVKSDDNIDEIRDKIDYVIKNKEKIMKEYNKFRSDYSNSVVSSTKNFIGEIECSLDSNDYEKLISIVVPVYNTEEYLVNSLESILSAVIDDCEILVINDGSSDGSDDIINEYVLKYPNLIRYIKQENKGLGNVRNVALREAKGKYIASIDSDDSINYNFFRDSIKYLKDDVDIVIYDFCSVTSDGKFQTPAIDPVFNSENRYCGLLYTTIMPSTCNKIIKKSLFDKLDIKYIEDKYEDLSTNPFILLSAQTIKYIPKGYYEYYIRDGSIMRSSSGYSMIDVLKIFDERFKKYSKYFNVLSDDFKFFTYSWRIEEFIMNQLYSIDESELKQFIDYIYDNIFDIVSCIFSSNRYNSVIDGLKDEKNIKYIKDRNKSFNKKKLFEFIVDARKKSNYFKLTPSIIYYGE